MSSPSFTTVLLADGTAIKTDVNGRNFEDRSGSILFQGRSISVHVNNDGMWEEVVEKKNTSTVLLLNGTKIEAEIAVLSRDGNNGCTVVDGDTSFPIPIHKNAFGVWVEVIEESDMLNEIYENVTLADGSVIEAAEINITEKGKGFILQPQEIAINVRKDEYGEWEEVIEEKEDGTSKAIAELLEAEVTWVEDNRAYISSKQHGSSRWHIVSETYDGGVQIDQTVSDEKYPSRVNFAPDEVPFVLTVLLAAYLKNKNTSSSVLGDIPEHPF